MNDSKVPFNCYWHCDEDGAHTPDVPNTKADGYSVFEYPLVVIIRERREPKNNDADQKIDEIERRQACKIFEKLKKDRKIKFFAVWEIEFIVHTTHQLIETRMSLSSQDLTAQQ